jgi:hypothetical protein
MSECEQRKEELETIERCGASNVNLAWCHDNPHQPASALLTRNDGFFPNPLDLP